MRTHKRTCKVCYGPVLGRSDKIYCSDTCKAIYHADLKKKTNKVTAPTDKILHRNRSTLFEIMGENATKKMVSKHLLDAKKFNYSYFTGIHRNKQGKTVYLIYDFGYLIFTNQEVLIYRNKRMRQSLP